MINSPCAGLSACRGDITMYMPMNQCHSLTKGGWDIHQYKLRSSCFLICQTPFPTSCSRRP